MPEAIKLTYTNNGDGTGHTVWHNASRIIGRVVKLKATQYLAVSPTHMPLGTAPSMSEAGELLEAQYQRKHAKYETPEESDKDV